MLSALAINGFQLRTYKTRTPVGRRSIGAREAAFVPARSASPRFQTATPPFGGQATLHLRDHSLIERTAQAREKLNAADKEVAPRCRAFFARDDVEFVGHRLVVHGAPDKP
jgi:hypothetical protein